MAKRPPVPLRERMLLTVDDVAELLRISRSMVYELLRKGWVPRPIEVGGRDTLRRWRREEISAWVRDGCKFVDDWTWRPTVVGRLDDLIQARHRELEELQQLKAERTTTARIGLAP